MLPLVPAVQSWDPGTDLLDPDTLTGVRAPAELLDLAGPLGLPAAAEGNVVLELSAAGLANLPSTRGLRADGADPDGERHGLEITSEGVRIWAATREGLFRGVTTLDTLLRVARSTGRPVPGGTVLDAPRFAWRGLSLDTVRRFFPVGEVERIIDLLALHKLNVLHLHLTDAEGWRFPVPSRPVLTEIAGATARGDRPGGSYSTEEYRGLVRYAAERFVTVVPEIDLPGHTAAALRALPELAGDGAGGPMSTDPMLQFLHPDQPGVFEFVTDVVEAVVASTPGHYVHIGGDESWGMPHEAYQRFVQRAAAIVRDHGKHVVAWQEATRAPLPASDLIQYWQEFSEEDLERLQEVAADSEVAAGMSAEAREALLTMLAESRGDVDRAMAAGNPVLVSISPKNYLDTPYAEAAGDPAQEQLRSRLGMPFYPASTVLDFADWDPDTVHPHLAAEAVVGVEGALWCETVESFDDASFLLLPRLAGVAERGWSAPVAFDRDDLAARLAVQAVPWRDRGLTFFGSAEIGWID